MDTGKLAHLVKEAQSGSEEAFAELYRELSKPSYYLALKMLKNEHDAMDAVQESMIRLYRSLDGVQSAVTLRAYVNRIVYNACLNMQKKRKLPLLAEDEEYVFDALADTDEEILPQEVLERRELREMVLRLVEELSDATRPVVILYYYQGLSVKEIAYALDIAPQAVKNRLFQARANIKKKLEKEKGGLIKSLLPLLAILFLPRWFRMDAAAASLSPGQAAGLWQTVAGEAAPGGALVSHGASATAPATGGTISAAGGAAPVLVAAVVLAAVGGAVLLGVNLTSDSVPAAGPANPAGASSTAAEPSPDSAVVTSQVPESDTAVPRAESSAAAEPKPVHQAGQAADSPTDQNQNPPAPPRQPETPPQPPAEQSAPDRPAQGGNAAGDPADDDSGTRPTPPESAPTIAVEHSQVTLEPGTQPTQEELMAMAGARPPVINGRAVPLELRHYHEIDFTREGKYIVYLVAEAGTVHVPQRALIVAVQAQ